MSRERFGLLTVLLILALGALGGCGPVPESAAVQEATAVAEVEVAASETLPAQAPEPEPTETLEPEPTETPVPELRELRYPLPDEPGTLDPHRATDMHSEYLVIAQLSESLFEYRGDGSIEPTGATGFEVSEDGRVYTIHLRPEAVWSDGVPVVAQHYVDDVLRSLSPETDDYDYTEYDIEGAEAFKAGETDDPATVGVRAVDDHTLEVRLVKPVSYFEAELALGWSPIRLDLIDEHGERWTEPGNYPSNGPYLLDAWVHGDRVVLVKNPTYWNADAVGIEQITLPIMGDDGSEMEMYEKSELHSTGERSNVYSDLPRVQADPVLSRELQVLPRPGVHYMGLNTQRPPTDDVLVRKALALAIDRQSWLQNATPASCTTPPMIPGHQLYGACGHTFDPEQARALLAEAGYPGGEGFPPLQAWTNRGGNEDRIETVAAMWEENLGISVEVDVYEWDRYLDFLDGCIESEEALAACEFNLYLMGWVMDYGDAQNQLDVVFAPYSTYQYTGWESERYEELMALASTELDGAQRAEYYKEADRILCETETAIIPIFIYDWKTLVKEGVTSEFPPFSHPAFKHWALP